MEPITWRFLYRVIENMTPEEKDLPAIFKFKGEETPYYAATDFPPIETFPWAELHPDPYTP